MISTVQLGMALVLLVKGSSIVLWSVKCLIKACKSYLLKSKSYVGDVTCQICVSSVLGVLLLTDLT